VIWQLGYDRCLVNYSNSSFAPRPWIPYESPTVVPFQAWPDIVINRRRGSNVRPTVTVVPRLPLDVSMALIRTPFGLIGLVRFELPE
jgi:hypothetical protein